jgi:hypothetical protein
LNEKLQTISNIQKAELDLMKKRVFNGVQTSFNLDIQIEDLIRQNVF